MDKPFPLVDGHADPELSDNGREQAERLAERLAKDPIDAHLRDLAAPHGADGGAAGRSGSA